jgi:hypothetical protein
MVNVKIKHSLKYVPKHCFKSICGSQDLILDPYHSRLQGPAALSHRRSCAHHGQTTFPGLILLSGGVIDVI